MDVLTGRLARVALLAVIASAVSSCGGGSGRVARSGAVPAFCARLPAADVTRVAHLSGQLSVSAHAPQECDYGTGGGVIDALIGEEAMDRTTFDKSEGQHQGAVCTPEAGLGETAYACLEKPDFLVVHFYSHGLAILVQVNAGGPSQPENTRSLARFAATRL